MRKKILIALAFIGIATYVGVAHGQQILGAWPFSAPKVENKDYIDLYAQAGDIVFEAGSVNKFYGWNGSSWVDFTASASATNLNVLPPKTSAYTLDPADDLILANASSGTFTLTLPAAAGNSGKVFRIKKTDSTFNAVTIDGNSSETIDGQLTTTVNTEDETLTIVSDGTNWEIIERRIPSGWQSYTPTYTGMNATGSVTTDIAMWKRDGSDILLRHKFTIGTSQSATETRLSLPSGLTIASTVGNPEIAGTWEPNYVSAGPVSLYALIQPSVTYINFGVRDSGSAPLTKYSGGTSAFNSLVWVVTARAPISGWNP